MLSRSKDVGLDGRAVDPGGRLAESALDAVRLTLQVGITSSDIIVAFLSPPRSVKGTSNDIVDLVGLSEDLFKTPGLSRGGSLETMVLCPGQSAHCHD